MVYGFSKNQNTVWFNFAFWVDESNIRTFFPCIYFSTMLKNCWAIEGWKLLKNFLIVTDGKLQFFESWYSQINSVFDLIFSHTVPNFVFFLFHTQEIWYLVYKRRYYLCSFSVRHIPSVTEISKKVLLQHYLLVWRKFNKISS